MHISDGTKTVFSPGKPFENDIIQSEIPSIAWSLFITWLISIQQRAH